jgi:hypothetical protein
MRHDHIQYIRRAAQEDDDERIAARRDIVRRECEARHP